MPAARPKKINATKFSITSGSGGVLLPVLTPGGSVQYLQGPISGAVPNFISVILPGSDQTSGWGTKKDPYAGFVPGGVGTYDKNYGI